MNEVVNVRVLPAFGLVRSGHFSTSGHTRVWWRNSLLEGKGSGAAEGVQRNTCSVRPGAAGACISALHRADGRVKQDYQSVQSPPGLGSTLPPGASPTPGRKSFQLHASQGV